MKARGWGVFFLLMAAALSIGWVVVDPWQVFAPYVHAKPDYLSSYIAMPFHTTIARVTGDFNDTITFSDSNTVATWESMRHHYSKDQPWNSALDANDSLVVLDRYGADSDSNGHYLFNGVTFDPLRPISSACAGARWSPDPNFPHMRIGISANKIQWYDVTDCTKQFEWTTDVTTIADGVEQEGNLSADGRYIAVYDANDMQVIDLNPYDPNASRNGPLRTRTDCGMKNSSGTNVCKTVSGGWVSISPMGDYVVMSIGDNQKVYDVDPNLVITPHVYADSTYECYNWSVGHLTGADPATGSTFSVGHADMAVNPYDSNSEVIIGQKRSWCPNPPNGLPESPTNKTVGQAVMVRLSDGHVTGLDLPNASGEKNEASSHHFSTRNYRRPGWVYATYFPTLASNGMATNPDPSKWTRYMNEVIAIKMDGSGQVERFAHTHGITSGTSVDPNGCYRCEEHAVPSPDGLFVLFTSNWLLDSTSDPNTYSAGNLQVNDYLINTNYAREAAWGARRKTWVVPVEP